MTTVARRIVVTSSGFCALPAMVIETGFVATVHQRLARLISA